MGDRPHLGDRRGGDLAQVAAAAGSGAARRRRARAGAGRRPGGASAARSRAPRRRSPPPRGRRRARRGSPRAARGWRGCWSAGVRSSCEASATKSRCAWIICWVSARAASSSRSIWSRVVASSATSSSDSGIGSRREGSRVAVISRAAAVSEEIGRIARPATATPGQRGHDRAADHAEGEEEPELVQGRPRARRGCARTGRRSAPWSRARSRAAARRRRSGPPRGHVSGTGGPRSGAPRRLQSRRSRRRRRCARRRRRSSNSVDEIVAAGLPVESRALGLRRWRSWLATLSRSWRKSSLTRSVARRPTTSAKATRITRVSPRRDAREAPAHGPAARGDERQARAPRGPAGVQPSPPAARRT